jgi:hypothetical protein
MTGSGVLASYFGLTQTDPVQGVVALEDLHARGVEFARATRPLSIELARGGLDALAALHGQSWGDDRPRRLGVQPLLSEATEPILQDFFAALPERFAAPRGFAAPVALHDPDRLRAAYAAYQAEVHRSAVCVVHGDAHRKRLRRARRAGGFRRLADRRARAVGARPELLRRLRARRARPAGPRARPARPLPEGARHVRRVRPRTGRGVERLPPGNGPRILGWLCNPDQWQPAEVNTATYARFGMAMIDHDTHAALGV